MTLRTRLALALVALAGLSVAVAGSINYAVTSQRLYTAADAGLKSFAAALTASGTATIYNYCPVAVVGVSGAAGKTSLPAVAGMPDVVQCVFADGGVITLLGPPNVILRAAARGGGPDTEQGPWTETLSGQDYRVMTISLPAGELRIARSLAPTQRVLDGARTQSVTVGLVITSLAAAAGVLIARLTSAPVTLLTATAERIAATGDLGIEVPTGRRDEVGRLARAFAAMLAALTRSREQQHRLVQDAGHELRTPLTSLRSNVDTLRRYPALGGNLRERVLADLDSELRALSALVDELVALALDRHGDEATQHVDVDKLVERASDRTRRRSGRAVVMDTTPVRIAAKPGQLLRAVSNLLDNAVKFSPDGTSIDVTVRPDRIEVRDHGPGIAPADLPHVFDRFYRATSAPSVPGSGLGLAIVAHIAQDCGGTVTAANHPNGGAVITIHLPAATTPQSSST
ncbi:sensor histidine kinase [Streptomyces sp. JNUCC 63]